MTALKSPKPIFGCAVRASFSARANPAWRIFASLIWPATRRLLAEARREALAWLSDDPDLQQPSVSRHEGYTASSLGKNLAVGFGRLIMQKFSGVALEATTCADSRCKRQRTLMEVFQKAGLL